jgi:hypothetical protein
LTVYNFMHFHFPNMSVLYKKPGIVRKRFEYTKENDQRKKDIRTNNGQQQVTKQLKS